MSSQTDAESSGEDTEMVTPQRWLYDTAVIRMGDERARRVLETYRSREFNETHDLSWLLQQKDMALVHLKLDEIGIGGSKETAVRLWTDALLLATGQEPIYGVHQKGIDEHVSGD